MKTNNDEKTGEKEKWKEIVGGRSGWRLLEKIDGVNIRLAMGKDTSGRVAWDVADRIQYTNVVQDEAKDNN